MITNTYFILIISFLIVLPIVSPSLQTGIGDDRIGIDLIPTAPAFNNATGGVNSSAYADFWDLLDTPADISLADLGNKDHDQLDNLAWSVAGHTFDTDLDMNGNTIISSSGIVTIKPSGGTANYLFRDGYFSVVGPFLVRDDIIPYASDVLELDLGNSSDRWDNLFLSENATAKRFKGTFNWTSADDWNIFDGSTLDFNESMLATIYYNATHSQAIVGTIDGGTLVNTQHQDGNYDGVTFDFSEEAGAPGLDLRMNFTDIVGFNRGIIRYQTSDLSGDFPIIQLWSYTDLDWEDYPVLAENDAGFVTITQPVFDDSEHIGTGAELGVVQMRLYKASNGNTNNHYYIDWVSISKGFGTPSGEEVDPFFEAWLNNPQLTGNLNSSGWINTTSNISADTYFGDGSELTGISTANDSYVLKSGDSMTGDLEMIGNEIKNVTRVYTHYLQTKQGENKIWLENDIVPTVGGTHDLGNSSNRMNDVYAFDGDFLDDVTITDNLFANNKAYVNNNLYVNSSVAEERGLLISRDKADVLRSALMTFRRYNGGDKIDNGEALGEIAFHGWDGDNYQDSARIYTLVDGVTSDGVIPIAMQLWTGTASWGSTRLSISSIGEIKLADVYSDTVGGTNRDLYIDNTGKIGYVYSSERYKENIVDLNNSYSSRIYDLQPKIYNKINESVNEVGLIAEEVELIMPELVSYQRIDISQPNLKEGDHFPREFITSDIPESVSYSKLVIPMLNEMKILKEENNLMKASLCKLGEVQWC